MHLPRRIALSVAMRSALLALSATCVPLVRLPAQASSPIARDSARVTARPESPDTLAPARLLATLQDVAVSWSLELASWRARLAAARARAAASGFAPPLAVAAGVSEAPNANLDQGNLRFEIGRDLLLGPRLRAERDVAAADVIAAEAALASAERRIRLMVTREALRAAGSRLIAQRLNAEDALLAGGEDGVRARFGVGQARYADVLRVRTERLRVQTERAAALAESGASAAALGGLLGHSSTRGAARTAQEARLSALLDTLTLPTLVDAWRRVIPEDVITDEVLDRVIATAGEVQLANAAVVRTRAERDLARAIRRPQLSALAGLQRIGQANSGRAVGPSVGITVSLPFTARVANQRAADADAQALVAAEATRTAAQSAVSARVEAAAVRFVAARERLAVFDAALLRGARDERENALAAYRSGALSLLELVDFERALARAEIDRIRTLVQAAAAWTDFATGGSAAEPTPSFTTGSAPEESPDAR